MKAVIRCQEGATLILDKSKDILLAFDRKGNDRGQTHLKEEGFPDFLYVREELDAYLCLKRNSFSLPARKENNRYVGGLLILPLRNKGKENYHKIHMQGPRGGKRPPLCLKREDIKALLSHLV